MSSVKVNLASLALLLVSLTMFTSCLSDGDETITLEYGSPRKMIIGRWKLSGIQQDPGAATFVFPKWREGTVLSFYSDGTYTDSSDGGSTRHTWRLGSDSESDPYYGGIDLDRHGFDIGSLGQGCWRLEYPKGSGDGDAPGWTIGLDKESDDPDGASTEPDPHPVQYAYRVSKVERYDSSTKPTATYTISYGSDGKPRGITTSKGTYSWTIANNVVTLQDAKTRKTLKTCTLDSDGKYVTGEEGVDASANGYTASMEYDSKGYLRKFYSTINNVGQVWTLSSGSGSSLDVEQTLGSNTWSSVYSFRFDGDNDSNIDLNPFIKTMLNDVYLNDVLAPFDFYGHRYPLIASETLSSADFYYKDAKVTRNEHGLVSEVTMNVFLKYGTEPEGKLRIVVSYEASDGLK